MGTDDLFKKRREARKQRKHDMKTPKANTRLLNIGSIYILIIVILLYIGMSGM